jgi:hypothetical protein
MTSIPMCPAMAALRGLRRAAWMPTNPDQVIVTVASLVEPVDTLIARWESLSAAIVGYEEDRCGESWDLVHEALLDVDDALGVFFGPSGWERAQGDGEEHKRPRPPVRADRGRKRTDSIP